MDRRAFMMTLGSLPAWHAAPSRATEFAAVLPGKKLVFPADYGAHPEFRSEWWYATGWLALPDGSPLGFQATFFRVRTGIAESNPSTFAPRQLVLAHAAIADPKLGRLRAEERAGRAGPGRAGFAIGRTAAWIGDWRLEQRSDAYLANVSAKHFSYALRMAPGAPPVANGIAGFSAKAADPRHASYYYSRPQLTVDGTVTLDAKQHRVSGRGWLDHEWSSELLPEGAQGWDWVGLNFDDGSALMAFRMRGIDGATLWTSATLTPATGVATALSPREVGFAPQRQWRSPRTGINYPVAWILRIGQRSLQLEPLLDDQELDSRRTTGAVYWEGAVRVRESGQEVGRGYLEMTGYGEKIRVG